MTLIDSEPHRVNEQPHAQPPLPVIDIPHDAGLKRMLRVLLRTFIALAASVGLLGVADGQYVRAGIAIAGSLGYAILLVGLNRWGARRTGYLCTALYFVLEADAMANGYGIHDITLVLFPAGIFLGALLLERRHVLPMIILAVALVGAVGIFSHSKPVAAGRPELAELAAFLVLLIVSAMIAQLILGSVQETIAERHRAEEELQRTEARFRTLFEEAPVGICVTRESAVLYANPKFCQMFIIADRASVIGRPVVDFFAPRSREESRERARRRVLGLPVPSEFESTGLRTDGQQFPAHLTVAEVALSDGPARVAFINDITDLIRAKAYVDNLIENANVLIVELDLAGHVNRLNRMGEEITGYTRDDFRDTSWFEKLAPPGYEAAEAHLAALRRGRMVVADEAPIVTRDGRKRIIAWRNSNIRDESGEVSGLISFGVDITERRRAEAEKQRLQQAMLQVAEEWRLTFDSVNTPILITDAAGNVVRVNEAARTLSGKRFREIVGHPVAAIADGEPWQTASELIRYMAREGSGTSAETHDPSGRTWEISVARFSLDPEPVPRFILVLWEVTEIVELQESLRRNETMAAMGTLVGAVAHEVRNPLFGISATLDAYATELSGPALAECSRELRSQVLRLTQLMRELLDYGRPSVLTIEPAQINDVIGEAVRNRTPAASHARVTIRADVSDVGAILMDRGKMRQVFENLIDNAVQHAPAGSVVRVSSGIIAQAGRDWLECRVEDSGPGFRPETLSRVFDPFFSLRAGGTGLGLSIVQRIVHEHSGRVTAGNRSDGGGMITIRLPFTPVM